MRTLGVLSSKGGVGKSQVCRSLAVQILMSGQRSAIIDADEQGTCVAWSKRRSAPAPTVIPLGAQTIAGVLETVKGRGAAVVVIDTPPHAKPIINMAASAADVCLIVTGCFPEDLEAVGTVAAIVKGIGKPTGIIINKTPSRSHALTMARTALATFGLPICPIGITQLVTHPYASAVGQTAQEREPEGKGASELKLVWEWVGQAFAAQLEDK